MDDKEGGGLIRRARDAATDDREPLADQREHRLASDRAAHRGASSVGRNFSRIAGRMAGRREVLADECERLTNQPKIDQEVHETERLHSRDDAAPVEQDRHYATVRQPLTGAPLSCRRLQMSR